MEIGTAITQFYTKIAFQMWVTQVWSQKPISKTGLEHFCNNKKMFFLNIEKDGHPK